MFQNQETTEAATTLVNCNGQIPSERLNVDKIEIPTPDTYEINGEFDEISSSGELVTSSAPPEIAKLTRSRSIPNYPSTLDISLDRRKSFFGESQYQCNILSFTTNNAPNFSNHQQHNQNNNNNFKNSDCLYKKENNNADSLEKVLIQPKQIRHIQINRDVCDLNSFVAKATASSSISYHCTAPRKKLSKLTSKAKNTSSEFCHRFSPCQCFRSLFPIFEWLPNYSLKSYLLADIIAGLTVSILHIPQGIAYSLLAGLDPVHGLYVSFFPVLIYAMMGTSAHISVGTFAVASIMLNNIATKIGAGNELRLHHPPTTLSLFVESNQTALIGSESADNIVPPPPTTIEVLTSVCLLCGFIQVVMGFLRLGSLSLILSEHLVSAFSTAIAVHVATAQFTYIFGFHNLPKAKSGPFKLIKSWMIIWQHWESANINNLVFSGIMICILVAFKEKIEPLLKKRNTFPIPIDLLVVIFSIFISWLFKFNQNLEIDVVKDVPTGLPRPTVPRFDLMSLVFVDSIILSVVCFAVSLSLAKIFAKKHNYRVDANQELVALGSANIFSSFFLAYPCSAALSRSTLQEKVGGKTQIAGLVSCAIILTVLLLLAPYLYHLPKCSLSCIILVALKSMLMQIADLQTFWRISKLDGIAWIVTFTSVVILDIDLGLIVGVSVSLFMLLFRLAAPRITWLGQLATTEIYAETEEYTGLLNFPGIKIIRFGSPLFYLNVDVFKDQTINAFAFHKGNDIEASNCDISVVSDDEGMKKTLIIDLSGLSFIDKPGIDALVEVVKDLQKQNISTCLAMCPANIVNVLRRAKFIDRVGNSFKPCRMYPTIHDAVIDSM